LVGRAVVYQNKKEKTDIPLSLRVKKNGFELGLLQEF